MRIPTGYVLIGGTSLILVNSYGYSAQSLLSFLFGAACSAIALISVFLWLSFNGYVIVVQSICTLVRNYIHNKDLSALMRTEISRLLSPENSPAPVKHKVSRENSIQVENPEPPVLVPEMIVDYVQELHKSPGRI